MLTRAHLRKIEVFFPLPPESEASFKGTFLMIFRFKISKKKDSRAIVYAGLFSMILSLSTPPTSQADDTEELRVSLQALNVLNFEMIALEYIKGHYQAHLDPKGGYLWTWSSIKDLLKETQEMHERLSIYESKEIPDRILKELKESKDVGSNPSHITFQILVHAKERINSQIHRYQEKKQSLRSRILKKLTPLVPSQIMNIDLELNHGLTTHGFIEDQQIVVEKKSSLASAYKIESQEIDLIASLSHSKAVIPQGVLVKFWDSKILSESQRKHFETDLIQLASKTLKPCLERESELDNLSGVLSRPHFRLIAEVTKITLISAPIYSFLFGGSKQSYDIELRLRESFRLNSAPDASLDILQDLKLQLDDFGKIKKLSDLQLNFENDLKILEQLYVKSKEGYLSSE